MVWLDVANVIFSAVFSAEIRGEHRRILQRRLVLEVAQLRVARLRLAGIVAIGRRVQEGGLLGALDLVVDLLLQRLGRLWDAGVV